MFLAACLAGCRKEPPPRPWEAPKAPFWARSSLDEDQGKPFAYDPAASYEALVKTSMGEFRIGFYPQETPETVKTFITLAGHHYYDGLLVFRVRSGEFIEAGDPENTGAGVTGFNIKGELTARPFVPGTVGLARKENPDSGSSIWFVCLARKPEWDGKYSAFGYVKEGLDVVRRISQLPVFGDLAVLPASRQRPVDPPVIHSVEVIKVSQPADK
mgnify:CR=1 FL=1